MGGLISRTKTSNTQLPPKEEVAEDVPVLKHSLDFAWVTLATNDSYSLGALVLAHSLRIANTAHKLVVLITPVVSSSMREQLSNVFDFVKVVDVLDSEDEAHLALLKRPELGVTFTKIHCWRLVEFQKCVFLDADTLVLKNCDELFEREELSAAPDVGWPDCFNTGVFVYKPSIETFNDLIRFSIEQGSFDGGDQGLLNQFFSDWATKDISKHLPFLYNLTSVAVYSYIPAFKHYGSQIRIVHFIGSGKPWLQYMDPSTKTVKPTPGTEHLTSLLQIWWDIFCEKVHPSLTKNLECARGMSNQQTEACVNSITVETNNETVSSALKKPFTPYIDINDSRQINLPYHPFDVKSSSGELLNITFLAEREQEMLQENRCANQFSDISFSAEKSCSKEQEDNLKSEPPVYENPASYKKLIQQPDEIEEEQCTTLDKNNLCHEEEHFFSAITEEIKLEDEPVENHKDIQLDKKEDIPKKEMSEEERPEEEKSEEKTSEEEQSPFHYNTFFPDETCIHNYLEQNVNIYKPLGSVNKNCDIPDTKTTCDSKIDVQPQQSLPRFLTIAENDKRQSLNVHNGNFCSHDKQAKCRETSAAENISSFQEEKIRRTLSQENLNFFSHDGNVAGELQKSKSMSNLEANSASVEEISFWKSHPNLNSDPNKKYSMPKLKPLLPKQQNKSSINPNQTRPKITQYTEFHMSSDYKDVFDESYDKLGFVEKKILEQAHLRKKEFFTFPYSLPQGTPKKTNENHLKLVQQNSVHDLADLSSCQRQRGNQPLGDITQSNNSRTENACFLPVLKPLRPKKNENAFKNPKPKNKSTKERETKARMESRKAREQAKSQLEAKTKISNSHNVEEVLERLINFSKNYQNYFSDFVSENKETNKGKILAIGPGIFKKANTLEINHSDDNYSVQLYESPRLQYDKEFENGDAYFEDIRSRRITQKRIANGEAICDVKDECELKENREFYHFEDYLMQCDQESKKDSLADNDAKVAVETLPFQLNLMQSFKGPNTEVSAENKVENLLNNRMKKKPFSEGIDIKEKKLIEKETSMETGKNCNDATEEGVQFKMRGKATVHNEDTDCGTGYAGENDACDRNFREVDNRKIGVGAPFVLHEINENLTKGDGREEENFDRIVSQIETKVDSKVYVEHMSSDIHINALDRLIRITGNEKKSKSEHLTEDHCSKKVAQPSTHAEPMIASFSKQEHETFKAIGETVQVVGETSKAETRTGSSEAEKGKIQTSERKIKRSRSEADNGKWRKEERQKRRKSSGKLRFALRPENSSGDTLANVEHEKSHLSKSVDAPFRSPKLTAHSTNKTAQDSRKVDNLGSPEDISHNNSGIAGAIAKLSLQPGGLTGAESEAASAAQEDYIRRQNWEMGTMDYMGRDSFDNIWSKICETLDGKALKDANLDVATNNQDRTASKPATSKDELGSMGIGVSEGIKESEMNKFSRKAIVNEESDQESLEKNMNYTVSIVDIPTNINKEQHQLNGKVENIAKDNPLNVCNLAGGNSGDQGRKETLNMSSAFPKSVEAPEPFGKLFASGPTVVVPSVEINADDNEDKRNKFYIQESEDKMKDSEVKGAGSVNSVLPEYATHEVTATVETITDETKKRQDSSSEASTDVDQTKDIEREQNDSASAVSIRTPESTEKKQNCEIFTHTTEIQKSDSGKEQDFLASEKLIDITPTLKDDEEKEHESGSTETLSRDILIHGDDAQQLQDSGVSEASSDTVQIVKTDTEIDIKTTCEDLKETESVEVNKQRKGVLNKLLELVGVGTPTRDNKTKNEISKSVFYDAEEISDEDYIKNASKNSTKKDSFSKSVFYDTEVPTQIQINEGESVPKNPESNTELSEEQISEKCKLSTPLNTNQLFDCKPASDGEKNEDYFGDIHINYSAAKETADNRENSKDDKEKGKDSAFCETSLDTVDKSEKESASADVNAKVPVESHAIQSESGVKFSSDAKIFKPGVTIKFQPPENDSEIHDADVPGKHLEINEDSTLEERGNSIRPEEKGPCDLESIKTKIDGIIDEAKKVVEQLHEDTFEMKEGEHKNDVLKTEDEQSPISAGSSEISVKVFQSDIAEGAQSLPENIEVNSASNEDQKGATKEREQPQEEELLSREKEALQAFRKIFVSGPIFIKPDVPVSESSEQVTKLISESDTDEAASSAVKKDKSEEEMKDDTKVSLSDCTNLNQACEWRPKDSKSETDAVHRIFREIGGGQETCEKESSSVQASSASETEMLSEEEPIYCNIDDIEEIRVTSEEDRKSWKPQSSKLTEQILKAIPPPRRKPFSDAKAEGSAASPEVPQMLASIPPQSVSILLDRPITEEMVVAKLEAEETSSATAPPVPPRRTRSKGRQPPLPPPKKKKK